MSNLYKNIEALCKQNGISVNEMCKKMGQNSSFLYELKSGRTKDLSSKIKNKIAKFFKIGIEYLDREYYEIPCPLCGLQYDPKFEKDILTHNEQHQKWQTIVNKFGFCWSYPYREEAKSRARNLRDDHFSPKSNVNLTVEELADCYETIFKALYSRAVEHNGFSENSPSFEEYVASSLSVENRNTPPKDSMVYDYLVNKYGISSSVLVPGTTEFDSTKKITSTTPKSKEHSTKKHTDNEKNILNKYRLLDVHGKKVVNFILDEEYARCTAPEEDEQPMIQIKHSYYKVSAGRGFPLGNGDDWCDDEIEVPDTPDNRKADYALTIQGNSMEPVYYDGDIILVKEQNDVDIGQIGIFRLNGEGYIKKNGGDRLISLNGIYDDIIINEYDECQCLGRVIGRTSKGII